MFTEEQFIKALWDLQKDSLNEYENTGILNTHLGESDEIFFLFLASLTSGLINNQSPIISQNIRQFPSFTNDLNLITQTFRNSLTNRVFNTITDAIGNEKEKKIVQKINTKYVKNYVNNLRKSLTNATKYHGVLLTNTLGLTNHNFKTWNQTPNDKTRHEKMNGYKIPIKEEFWVKNDKSDVIELGRYPHDPKLSCANSCHCYCYLTFSEV